jgi:hypothetical protein
MTSPPEKPGEPPRGFTINDRREEFEEPVEAVPPTVPPEGPTVAGDTGKPPIAGKAPGPARTAAARPPHSASEPPLPPVEFATFVLSLGSSALMHLGEVERPGTGKVEKNLPMAKHSIDILSMLEGKTRGNLDAGEAQLLENLLFDLRLRYVEATRK